MAELPAMFVKVKSLVFIDMLQLQLLGPKGNCLRGILKDEKGSVCSTMEREIAGGPTKINWTGLNDLPYGKYTLELSHGEEEIRMNLVKTI